MILYTRDFRSVERKHNTTYSFTHILSIDLYFAYEFYCHSNIKCNIKYACRVLQKRKVEAFFLKLQDILDRFKKRSQRGRPTAHW